MILAAAPSNPNPTSTLSQIALVVAVALFVGIIAWLFLTPKSRWKHDAALPLDEAPRRAQELSKEHRP